MSLKLCVFDMAGTTVVDRQNVHAAFIEAMADFGYNVTLAEVNPLMGYKKRLPSCSCLISTKQIRIKSRLN